MADVKANPDPSGEPTSGTISQSDYDKLTAQNKGLQRQLNRTRSRAASGEKTDELAAILDVQNQRIEALTNLVGNAFEGDEASQLISDLNEEASKAISETKDETKRIEELYKFESDNDTYMDDVPVARAHFENGNYVAALEALTVIAAEDPVVEKERETREATKVVDTGESRATVFSDADPNSVEGMAAEYNKHVADGTLTPQVRREILAKAVANNKD